MEKATVKNPYDDANFFMRWSFSFVNPLLDVGERQALQLPDLYPLSSHDRVQKVVRDVTVAWDTQNEGRPSLSLAFFRAFRRDFFVSAGFCILESVARIAQPLILKELLNWLSSAGSHAGEGWFGWTMAALLGVMAGVQTLIHHILFYLTMRAGWNMKLAAMGLLHSKVLRLGGNALQQTTRGQIITLVSNDVQRYMELGPMGHFIWMAPFDVIAVFVLVGLEVGFLAAFAGVATTIICVPIQYRFSKRFMRNRRATATHTDERVRRTAEALVAVASVKAFGWEECFASLNREVRLRETAAIWKTQVMKAVNQTISFTSPITASFATFSVYWAQGNDLTPSTLFATLGLLHILRASFGLQWLRSVETHSEARVSTRRIETFLRLPERPINVQPSDGAASSEKVLEKQARHGAAAVHDSRDAAQVSLGAEQKTERFDYENAHVTAEAEQNGNGCASSESRDDTILRVDQAAFRWGMFCAAAGGSNAESASGPAKEKEEGAFTLSGLDFEVRKGELLLVVGPVGCGKSSLLQAILGEMPQLRGSVSLRAPQVAFAGQTPFIRACSVKDNVTFVRETVSSSSDGIGSGTTLTAQDEKRLVAALEACDLLKDAESFPDGLESEIGERGINLSGGQRARLSLARVCYSDAPLCLLDDVLSAVDPEVSSHLFRKAIRGALHDRAVVLVTHQLQYLNSADKVLVFDATGKVIACAPPGELDRRGLDITQYVTPAATATADSSSAAEDEDVALDSEGAAATAARRRSRTRSSSREKERPASSAAAGNATAEPTRLVVAEDRVIGTVSAATYAAYARRAGVWRVVGMFVLMVLAQGAFMSSDLWLTFWSQADNQRPPWRLKVFAGLVGLTILLGLARGFSFFGVFLRAANSVHFAMFGAVIKSPMHFFYENPTGRILNKFSKDQGNADELLPVVSFDALQIVLFALGAVAVVCATVPWVLLLVAPLGYFFATARKRYLASSREVKRLEATSRSPIYAEFSATLDGLTTLRAYKAEGATHRAFLQLLEDNGRAWYCFILVSRWLGFRLDAETSIFLLTTALLTVALKGSVNPGLAGFALLYSLSLSGQFQWAVRQTAETETHMTAVERMLHYAGLEPEPDPGGATTTPHDIHQASTSALRNKKPPPPPPPPPPALPANWPSSGVLRVSELRVRYRSDLPEVLRGISLAVAGGQKVGVVGRTGSGKSSLMLALLRLNQVTAGDILVDGVSLLSLPLATARSVIAWLPQEPHMFSGTLRFNLDPLGRSSDAELWAALEEVQLKDRLAKDPAGLDAEVLESGSNFSAGQRQLLSLARAILRKAPIIITDEATANVDYQTDALVQEMLRNSESLRSRTIVTVAHRLRTVIASDAIFILSSGKLIESGAPSELLEKDPPGALSRMVDKTGKDASDLRRMASDAAVALSLRRSDTSALTASQTGASLAGGEHSAYGHTRLSGKAGGATDQEGAAHEDAHVGASASSALDRGMSVMLGRGPSTYGRGT